MDNSLLKMRLLNAVTLGDIGTIDDYGTIITLREFKQYFDDIKSDYVNSFLPASTIEKGMNTATHSKFLFRIRKGVYRVHPDVINAYMNKTLRSGNRAHSA